MSLHDIYVGSGLAFRWKLGLKKGGPAAQDGERRAQVVGKGGVEAAALFSRAPQRALRRGQRRAHRLERGGQVP